MRTLPHLGAPDLAVYVDPVPSEQFAHMGHNIYLTAVNNIKWISVYTGTNIEGFHLISAFSLWVQHNNNCKVAALCYQSGQS